MLTSLFLAVALHALPAPEVLTPVDIVFMGDTTITILRDGSVRMLPTRTLSLDGMGRLVIVEASPHELVTTWRSAKGEHTVRTDCVTLRPPDCAKQHSEMVTALQEWAAPLPPKTDSVK